MSRDVQYTAEIIGWGPASIPPYPPVLGLVYESAIGQQS